MSNLRYFLVTGNGSTEQGQQSFSVPVEGNGYPIGYKVIDNVMRNTPVKNPVITNIHEFKSKSDYDEFFKKRF